MSDLMVEIVTLPPMRVAAALGFSESPENDAHTMLAEWAQKQGLLDKVYHSYGFNNPDPSPGSSKYGYELWITVGPEVKVSGEIEIKDIPGGLYAVTRCRGIQTIGEVWKALAAWRETSKYKCANHQWLEEGLFPLGSDLPIEEYVLDLYLPIAE